MTNKSWSKLGRQIRGHVKPNSLNHTTLTIVEVAGDTLGTWHRLDSQKTVEDHLIKINVEQFLTRGPLCSARHH
jgi:hypothetical protein